MCAKTPVGVPDDPPELPAAPPPFEPPLLEPPPDELLPLALGDGVPGGVEPDATGVGVAVPEGGHGVLGGGGGGGVQPQLVPVGVGVGVPVGVGVGVPVGVGEGLGCGGLPCPLFSHELPVTESRIPMTSTWFPHTLTGALIGTWSRLPATIPGEPLELPDADVEPLPPWFSHELPWSLLPMPITSSWLPHTLTGALIGTWMRLPEPTPGEPLEWPDAVVELPPPWFSQELPVTESRIPIRSS